MLYTLGELRSNEQVALEAHLQACEKCRAAVWALSDAIEDAFLEG